MSDNASRFLVDSTQKLYLPPTLQQSSNLQGLFKSGKIAIGTVLSYPSRHVAKTIAITGADWCWLDAEHVAWSPALLVECIQIIIHESAGKMIPVVRVPSKTAFDYMAWCLDAGAGGIIVPHLETAKEMEEVVAACRFPPIGHRSFPPFTFIPGVTDITPNDETIFSLANKHTAIIPQIESKMGSKTRIHLGGERDFRVYAWTRRSSSRHGSVARVHRRRTRVCQSAAEGQRTVEGARHTTSWSRDRQGDGEETPR
ncbi:Pyruvate/Phosphoenolpyruvate kinase-like domain-containing protein [Mycena leptocephala]|nr:Pyruvate/Phosphoenolpyruvate kinase-like domain-containing protein [Mycena leptocephala]